MDSLYSLKLQVLELEINNALHRGTLYLMIALLQLPMFHWFGPVFFACIAITQFAHAYIVYQLKLELKDKREYYEYRDKERDN